MNEKHKGAKINSLTKVYHKSNPKFRAIIASEGLKPMKGDSYSCHSPEETEEPAIFGYFGDIDYYDSTWDDDIWEIDVTLLENIEWYIDIATGGHIMSAVVTYSPIPSHAIKLVYQGTGLSL